MSTLYVDNLQPRTQPEITMPARIAYRAYASRDSGVSRPSIVTGWETDGVNKQSFDQSQGYFSAGAGIFTAPVTGLYMMSLKYTPTTTDNFRALIKLYINGANADEIIDQEPADYFMSHDVSYAGLHKFTAGTQVSIYEESTPSGGTSSFIWTMYSMG